MQWWIASKAGLFMKLMHMHMYVQSCDTHVNMGRAENEYILAYV